MNLTRLLEPFQANEIEWRIGQCGLKANKEIWAKGLAYITARAGQERLDEVFTPLGWQTNYTVTAHGVLCHLKVNAGEQWIEKTDGAQETDFEAFKGGISGAFKRVCASGLGIGRYLYELEEIWLNCSYDKHPGWHYAKDKTVGAFYWETPQLPDWALPKTTPKKIVAHHNVVEKSEIETGFPESSKVTETIVKALAKALQGRDLDKFQTWLEEKYHVVEFADILKKDYTEILQAIGKAKK